MSTGLSLRVTLSHARVTAAAGELVRRSWPSSFWYWVCLALALYGAIELGYILAFMLVQLLPFPVMFAIGTMLPDILPVLLALMAVMVANVLYDRAVWRAIARKLRRDGVPDSMEVLYEVLEDGLRLTSARTEVLYRGGAIGEVAKVKDGWVVASDTGAMFVPSAGFDDMDAERAFVTALLALLSREARARSADAVRFAGEDQAPVST
jgi:hypothetical protein